MKRIIFILFLAINSVLNAQHLKKSRIIAFTPELETEVNGMGMGLMINSLKYSSDTVTTRLNGLNVEIIGVGLFGPIVPSDPLMPYDVKPNELAPVLDSLIAYAKKPKPYVVNGLSISLGGLAGHEVQMNGLNISGVSTLTSKTNGVSLALLMNLNSVMHGVSIGIFNESLEHKGLQIGLINSSKKTRGFQIGLWNKNEKRSLPIINWNF